MKRYNIYVDNADLEVEEPDGEWVKYEDHQEVLKTISKLIDLYDFDEDGNGYASQLHEIEEIINEALKEPCQNTKV